MESKRERVAGWTCETCTFFNEAKFGAATPMCAMCCRPRPTKWWCESCRATVTNASKCARCNKRNPEIETMKVARNSDGGWNCPKRGCNVVNKWSSRQCRSCQEDNLEIDPLPEDIEAALTAADFTFTPATQHDNIPENAMNEYHNDTFDIDGETKTDKSKQDSMHTAKPKTQYFYYCRYVVSVVYTEHMATVAAFDQVENTMLSGGAVQLYRKSHNTDESYHKELNNSVLNCCKWISTLKDYDRRYSILICVGVETVSEDMEMRRAIAIPGNVGMWVYYRDDKTRSKDLGTILNESGFYCQAPAYI